MTRDQLPTTNAFWTLGLSLLAILLLLQLTTIPQRINLWLYDALITTHPAKVADNVAIVAIDDASLDRLGGWPWSRSTHADLIRKLDDAGARTIVFDILFPEPSADDQDLAEAMKAHGNVVLPIHLSPPSQGETISEYLPTPTLSQAAAGLGHAHVELDPDGLARGLYLFNGLGKHLWPSLALAAHGAGNGKVAPPEFPQDSELPPYVNVRSDYVAVPLAGPAETYPMYSYANVLLSPPAPREFNGKTVFVGATAPGFGDVLPTPFSNMALPLSGVEFHANSYAALANQTLIRPSSGIIAAFLSLAIILLVASALPRLRPTQTLLLCTTLAAALLALFTTLILVAHRWIPVANALLVPLIAFPLWSARRLAITTRFLNRQLDELGHGPQLSLRELSERHPIQLLDYLTELFTLDGWLLMEDDKTLSHHNLSRESVPPRLPRNAWIHRQNLSWLNIDRCDSHYVLGLKLPDSLSGEAVQRYLRQLPLSADLADKGTLTSSKENITARIERVRQATERMNNMQTFILKSFEHMPDGIIVTDELGVIQFANRHIEEWFDEPRPSLTGLPLTRLLQGHDPRNNPAWKETLAETLTLAQSRTVDLRIRGKDFLIHLAPFESFHTRQQGLIANISDITELREQQRQHREAIDFISHDVRSPLVSQLALIEQLKRHPTDIDTDQLEQLGRLARRSYQLAEEFVQLARAEQLTETRFYECELLSIVENARDSVIEQAFGKDIKLQLQGYEDLWLKGNAELLERVVINLLTNAVQYSDTGSTITIQVYQAGHLACLTVSDEGAGIAPEEVPHLFDRFRRQKSSELSGNRGAGLGLSFVNVVIEKHRGQIEVESTLGEGSSFTIKLPIAAPIPN
ncbi:CHASE2 domain-containing protein [Marinobacter mobilis]|uniref:histidine kinase n=1 Tax=Marinobacter mobilis TaxID=488533 RepID=A0A1H3DFS7_9GAMM|nr:CHASE2 domain-containing protein [Marinobacter mobilis]SDX64988.1 PAS domain S-box-containing protein [Marinobacter mobilis]